jgi:hypothetical protein
MKIVITESQKLLLENNTVVNHARKAGLTVYIKRNRFFQEVKTDDQIKYGHDKLFFLSPEFVEEYHKFLSTIDQMLRSWDSQFKPISYDHLVHLIKRKEKID